MVKIAFFMLLKWRGKVIKDTLKARGVNTLIHYPVPIWKQAAYSNICTADKKLKVASFISNNILSLPIWPDMPDKFIRIIIDSLKAFSPN